MSGLALESFEAVEEPVEDKIIAMLRPEFNYICMNSIRACMIHMMIGAKELGHSLQVEEISRRLGKRHSVIIYHLEQLEKWNIVRVVKSVKYGSGNKRSIWGLNLKYPNLIRSIYGHILKFFYTPKELDKMCSLNKDIRKPVKGS